MEADVTTALGARLREMRRMRGLSLRDQARALELSPSTLSELERGIAGVSLQRLQFIAQSLGVSLSHLVSGEEEVGVPARTLEILTAEHVGEGSIRRGRGVHYTLIGAAGAHSLQPYRITFDAGAGYADDPIKHPGEEFVHVTTGSVYLHLANKRHQLLSGAFARFDSGTPHAFANASDTDVAVIVGAGTPPW